MTDNGKHSKLLGSLREFAAAELSVILEETFDEIDDTLFNLAEKADNQFQSSYFAAIREIRVKRYPVEKAFTTLFNEAFTRETNLAVTMAEYAATQGKKKIAAKTDSDIEVDAAVNSMAGKLAHTHADALMALTKRISVVLAQPQLEQDDNPLHPKLICQAFKDACAKLECTTQIRLVILELFEGIVSNKLQGFYQQLNQVLIDEKILPEFTTIIQRPEPSSPPLTAPPVSPLAHTEQPNHLLPTLQQLLEGTLYLAQVIPPNAASTLDQSYLQKQTALQLLTRLQQETTTKFIPLAENYADFLLRLDSIEIVNILHGLREQVNLSGSNELEAQTIDIVAMLFDCVLDDKEIPKSMKALLARLQIPMLKVALLDGEFYINNRHPARCLLNDMAASATRWLNDPAAQESLYTFSRSIIGKIDKQFDQDTAIFESLANVFEEFIAKEELKVIERQEALIKQRKREEKAKHFVRDELVKRVNNHSLPEPIKGFLFTHWKSLMVMIYVKKGPTSKSMEVALQTMDDLIWTAQPKILESERQRLYTMLPNLRKYLVQGMKATGMADAAKKLFLTRLAQFYTQLLQNPVSANTGPDSVLARTLSSPSAGKPDSQTTSFMSSASVDEETPKHSVQEINPELEKTLVLPPREELFAQMKNHASSTLDLSNTAENPGIPTSASPPALVITAESSTDLTQLSQEEILRMVKTGQLAVEELTMQTNTSRNKLEEDDEFTGKVNNLQPGVWLTILGLDGSKLRAQLSSINPDTGIYIFADQQGNQIAERTRNGLIMDFRRGTAKVIEEQGILDRAFSKLLGKLSNSAA